MNDITLGLLNQKPPKMRYKHYEKDGLDSYEHDVYLKIIELIPEGSRVLDVGCGAGNLTRLIQERRKAVIIGIERDPEQISILKSSGLNVYDSDFNMVSEDDLGKFDIILFADVIEHFVSPGLSLRKAHSLLKPEGIVIASVPNVAHWSIRLNLLLGNFEYQPFGLMDAMHLRWFTRETVKRLFCKTGFKIESMTYTIGTWLPAYSRWPWKWFGGKFKERLIQILVKLFPNLFGCQFIIKAKKL